MLITSLRDLTYPLARNKRKPIYNASIKIVSVSTGIPNSE